MIILGKIYIRNPLEWWVKKTFIHRIVFIIITSIMGDIFVEVPGLVLDILYLTAVLNSCVNPIIYGIYFYVENRPGNAGQTNTSRFCNTYSNWMIF